MITDYYNVYRCILQRYFTYESINCPSLMLLALCFAPILSYAVNCLNKDKKKIGPSRLHSKLIRVSKSTFSDVMMMKLTVNYVMIWYIIHVSVVMCNANWLHWHNTNTMRHSLGRKLELFPLLSLCLQNRPHCSSSYPPINHTQSLLNFS